MPRCLIFILALFLALPAQADDRQVASEKDVASLGAKWIPTQLNEHAEHGVVLSLCGRSLHSCDKAKRKLRELATQCSKVFLAIIDLEAHPEISQNYYDADDPTFIPLLRREGHESLESIKIMAEVNPDTVAVAMCPLESKAFGAALRSLQRMAR